MADALASLLGQSFRDFETVISDNASTDGTVDLLERAAERDGRLSIIRQRRNIGAAANFRAVLAAARGEYFMWAAHDDRWHTDFLAETVAALDDDASAAFAVTGAVTISRRLGPIGKLRTAPMAFVEMSDGEARLRAYDALPLLSHKDNLVYSLWRTAAIRDVIARVDPAVIGMEMNRITLRLYRGRFIDRPLFEKRYRTVAPGHPLEPAMTAMSRMSYAVRRR